jgi:hypothetical protein
LTRSDDHDKRAAPGDLSEAEFEEARRGISFKGYGKGASICHVGDRLES